MMSTDNRYHGGGGPTEPTEPPILYGNELTAIRIPPHDLHAEAAVLSGCMLKPGEIPAVAGILVPDAFYSDSHRLVFDALLGLTADGTPIDLLSVVDWLKSHELIQRAGGLKHVAALIDATPAIANLEQHARIVAEHHRKRRVMGVAEKIRLEGYGRTTDTWIDDAIARMRDAADCRDSGAVAGAWGPLPADMLLTTPPSRRWLLRHPTRDGGDCAPGDGDGLLPRGKAGVLAAEGGAGKTIALCQLAISVVIGKPWLGHFHVDAGARGRRVLLALAEETHDEVHRRLYTIANALRLDDEQRRRVASKLVVLPLAGRPVSLVRTNADREALETTELQALRRKLEDDAADGWALVVLDPLARWSGGIAESDNDLATRFVQCVESLTEAPGEPTVLVAHHSSKQARKAGSVDSRGVTGITDGFRWAGTLRAHNGGVCFAQSKSNYSRPMDDELELARERGGFLRTITDAELEARAEERQAVLDDKAAARVEVMEAEILAALAAAPGPVTSKTDLAALAHGRKADRLEAASRLLSSGRVCRKDARFRRSTYVVKGETL